MKKGSSTSIRAALLNLSQKEGLVFQHIITRYFHERLLYRLSLSDYRSRFMLKGGNLLYAIEGLHVRPTTDIDILAKHVANDKEKLKNIFKEICSFRYDDDCVHFDGTDITVMDIADEKKYSGIRLLINARFDKIKQTLQVDTGFGDIVIPAPVMISYPTLIDELTPPEIMAYSIETVIAEKFHAMIINGAFNSRMKDFYDVYILLKNNKINKSDLHEAILQTFGQRDTFFVSNHPLFSESFPEDSNRQTMWKAFLRKMKITGNMEFSLILKSILERLQPIYNELINSNKHELK